MPLTLSHTTNNLIQDTSTHTVHSNTHHVPLHPHTHPRSYLATNILLLVLRSFSTTSSRTHTRIHEAASPLTSCCLPCEASSPHPPAPTHASTNTWKAPSPAEHAYSQIHAATSLVHLTATSALHLDLPGAHRGQLLGSCDSTFITAQARRVTRNQHSHGKRRTGSSLAIWNTARGRQAGKE
jgi:hypothetical protein